MEVDKYRNGVKIIESNYVKETEEMVNNWINEMENRYGVENFELVNVDMERGLSISIILQYKIYD